MNHETSTGPSALPDRGRHHGGNSGQQSPLQARAAFIQNWSWESVIRYNRGACARGRAQHGFNSETQETVKREWEEKQNKALLLAETLDFLKSCHRKAPFLFFNGNTFADISRRITTTIFAELPPTRLRELTSVIAHYVAGVLDYQSMEKTVNSLWQSSVSFKIGDRVKTLRETLQGTVIQILEDGKIQWQPDNSSQVLASLPESLLISN